VTLVFFKYQSESS